MATNLQDMKRQGGAVATTPAQATKMRVDVLNKRKEALGAGASTALVVEREIRAAGVMIMNSKDLQEADPNTIYTSVSIAINSGIGLCNGHGYLVAYRGKCSFVPGWKGLVDLVSRSGRASVWTGVVYRGDKFDYELGGNPYLRHKPEGDSDDWREATHVYAVGRIKNSDFPILAVWTVGKVDKHLAKFNKVGTRHYALKDDNNREMYGRKVVLLQVLKYLPSSQDLDKAINAEVAAETGREMVIDGDFSYVPDAPAEQYQPQGYDDQQGQNFDLPHDQHDMQQHVHRQPAQADVTGAPAEQQDGEQSEDDKRATAFLGRLHGATDIDMLDADADLIKEFPSVYQSELNEAYRERRAYLGNPPPAGASAARRRPAAQQMNIE